MSNHHFVHLELWNTNPDETAKFYSEVFDWKIKRDPMPGDTPGEYVQFSTGEDNLGGAFPQVGMNPGGPQSPGPMLYIGTDDIPASLAKIEAAGGTILSPGMEIPGFGSMAIFQDTTGNTISLWKALD